VRSPGCELPHRAFRRSNRPLTVRWVRLCACFALFASFSASPKNSSQGGAQSGAPQTPKIAAQQPFGQIDSAADDSIGPGDPLWQEKQLRLLNADRQKQLVADTNKLLKLARLLNAEIAGANPDSFTPDQLRRIAEIEKLAHSVKEKMATPVSGTPMLQPQPPLLPSMR